MEGVALNRIGILRLLMSETGLDFLSLSGTPIPKRGLNTPGG